MDKSKNNGHAAAHGGMENLPQSTRWWDDENFQDRLVALITRDDKTAEECGSILVPEDFKPLRGMKKGRARSIVVDKALEHCHKYHKPAGDLLRANVLEYCENLNLGTAVTESVSKYLDYLQTLKPGAAGAGDLVKKVRLYKSQRFKAAAIQKLVDLQSSNMLTDEKWREISEEALSAGSGVPNAGLMTVSADQVPIRSVSWLWPGRIARGKLTVIAGDPGLAKSTIAVSISALVTGSQGRWGGRQPWPDGERCTANGKVVFLNAEDDAEDTLVPRLKAAGADLSRIQIVNSVRTGFTGDGEPSEKLFSLQKDLHSLDKKLAEWGDVALLVIDPVTAYLDGVDSHKNADVRGVLAPLKTLANKHNLAVVLISHINKDAARAMMSVSGSLAFVAAARAVYLVVEDAADPKRQRRLVLSVKNNLDKLSNGLAYTVESARIPSSNGSAIETARIVWDVETEVSVSAQEALQRSRKETPVEELGPKEREVLDLLRTEGKLKPADIAQKLGWKDANLYPVLQRLRDKREVIKRGVLHMLPGAEKTPEKTT